MDVTLYGAARDGAKPALPVFDIAAPCRAAAARWCASFGVRDAGARFRLEAAILNRLGERMQTGSGNLAALLDDLARDSIAAWFASFGADAGGRGFDRLRHGFLDANRDGGLGARFLDPEVDRAAMRGVLERVEIVPTPDICYRKMLRQTL